jgi:hypothetical protein
MTSHEFVIWFKGFAQAASDYTLTPAQWDIVKDQLDKVNNNTALKYTLEGNSSVSLSNLGLRSDITYKTDELTTNTVF